MAIQSIDRAIQILFSFSTEEPVLGINDLSQKLNLNQSTIHHLIQSLIAGELIEQVPSTRKYRLGIRTIELGGLMLKSRNLSDVVQPFLHHVADKLEETAYMGVLDNWELLNIDQVCGPHLIQHCGWQGRRTPLHCTSAGKVFLASRSEEDVDNYIKCTGLRAYTPNTITESEKFKQELHQVREQGYAINIGELEDQNNAISVPIKGQGTNAIVATLGVVGPAYRFSNTQCLNAAPFLKSVAVDISNRLILFQ